MTKERKLNLPTTLTYSIIGGSIAGYLLGSGIEDSLNLLNSSPLFPYFKSAASGLGALTSSVLSTMKYYNTDENEGKLVLNEEQPIKKDPIPRSENSKFEGLEQAVNTLTQGIHNKDFGSMPYYTLSDLFSKNFFTMNKNIIDTDSCMANYFDVFNPFEYGGRMIYPKNTLDKFFRTGEFIYNVMTEQISESAAVFVCSKKSNNKLMPTNFRDYIIKEISYAEDLALWATYLSKRNGIVGSTVREKLEKFGISNPDSLAHDVKVIGENILKLYDSKNNS